MQYIRNQIACLKT